MDYKQIPVIIPSLEPDEKLPRLLEQLHNCLLYTSRCV